MHETLTILIDVCGVCQSVHLSHGLNQRQCVQCTQHVCVGSFSAASVKLQITLTTCFSSFQCVEQQMWATSTDATPSHM